MRKYFSKVVLFFCLGVIFMSSAEVSAQIKVLIYADSTFDEINKIGIEQLKEKGKSQNIDFLVTYKLQDFDQEKLNDFQSIIFLNSGIENFELKQSNLLFNYFKKGRGFIGIHGSIQKKYKWLWFQNQINAFKDTETVQASTISIITNKQFVGLSILPYWKIFDKPLKISGLSSTNKPVLLDFSNNPLSWISNTPLGNKSFCTLLGGTLESWQNEVFIKHILSAVLEVSAKKANLEVSSSSYPSDSDFQTQILLDSIPNPQAFINLSESKIMLLYDKGNIGLFDLFSNKFSKIGFEPKLENVVKITKDPDFDSNNSLFCFTKTNKANYLVNKVSLLKDSLELSSIELTSDNNDVFKSKINPELLSDSLLGFPIYYLGKTFDLDEGAKIIIESVNEAGGIINKEPFPFLNKDEKIIDLGFDKFNTFYILTDNSLLTTYYSKLGFPKQLKPQINLEKNNILKMSLSADDEIPQFSKIEWLLNGQIISKEKTVIFQPKKSGNYEVEFRNYFGNRLFQKVSKEFLIKIGKK